MAALRRLERGCHSSPLFSRAQVEEISGSILHRSSFSSTVLSSLVGGNGEEKRREKGKWLTLPPFVSQKGPSSVGKELAGGKLAGQEEITTALKWVHQCFPHLPMSLVQKLFRLRQVRKELVSSGAQYEGQQLKRVSAKETLSSGEVILLPISVENFTKENNENPYNQKEIKFMRSLILYKDSAIIVINKPHGLPVQGGLGIRNSIDVLAATSLKFDSQESPKLVHRLDRDCSGLLILGRTQISTSILHSIFREKTSRTLKENIKDVPRLLQRKYWALVVGTPKHSSGLLSAPVGKVILEDGKSERITVIKERPASSQHALTEYKVIKTSNGYTWLELCPLTGRKHQLRVHCAEVLKTPIVGDYKYGWHAHKKWELIVEARTSKLPKEKHPFGLDFESGSISEKQPRLHLHCHQLILPNIAEAGRHLEPSSATKLNLAELDMLDLVAPLPPYMVLSWNILSF
ncbi:RNA pseudouridine synthase 4, mitochondrial isoform X2 [Phalaenopsis equestris]|uniref:RNA pseudouridine synthase 4, mitochondrial isoform X2 n=1 Tax=Phalaenopsis equestris TaxID=78828 RepID=UPI0009E23F4C|nr:RNA pseudouridine synthase 4, mitochondrial isoform X2 [Phalaenopsis equestris]